MVDVNNIGRFCVYDAPVALNSDLSCTGGLDPRLAEARNVRHLSNLQGCIVGPMPVEKFIDGVVGQSGGTRSALLSSKNAFRSVPATADTAEQIYEPLLVALNKQTKRKSRCPGFVFENTARRSLHPKHLGYAKPHISCFSGRNIETVRRISRRSRSELGYAELFIQVTPDAERDFFTDPPPELDGDLRAGFDFITPIEDRLVQRDVRKAFGLHVGFVTEAFARQHRNAFYTVSMAGSRARLFRWDRAGCIVSEAFDIRENPEHLCEFLWRFSTTSDASRGHDRSVTPATLEEELKFRSIIKEYVRSQLEVEGEALDKALSQHYSQGHAAILRVYPHRRTLSHSDAWRFIVSRPVVSPHSLVGRGTRGFWAVETTTSRVMFLKDTWHIGTDMAVEGDVLSRLNRIGVRNVPSLVTHGDVPDHIPDDQYNVLHWQATFTAKLARRPWACRAAGVATSTTDVRRYRLVMGTVGYGLSTIRGTEELLHATYDAFTSMRDALAKDSRVHRDISVGNIILVKEPGQEIRRGYLIDWEASTKVDDSGHAFFPGRVGTWYFMSWRMLHFEQADGKQTFLDDMEALIHVVTYCALLYLPHTFTKQELVFIIEDYFARSDEAIDGKRRHGGDAKMLNAHSHRLITAAAFGSAALVEWITTLFEYQCPPGQQVRNYEYGELWNPEAVDAFWADFLKTRALERDNRVVHDVTKERHFDFHSLSTTPPTPAPAAPAPAPTRKRAAVERDSPGDGLATKRRRSARLRNVAAPTSPSRQGSALHPPDGPRRSQRIKTIQDRAQAPASAPARAAAPKTRAAPSAARRASRGRGRGRSRR